MDRQFQFLMILTSVLAINAAHAVGFLRSGADEEGTVLPALARWGKTLREAHEREGTSVSPSIGTEQDPSEMSNRILIDLGREFKMEFSPTGNKANDYDRLLMAYLSYKGDGSIEEFEKRYKEIEQQYLSGNQINAPVIRREPRLNEHPFGNKHIVRKELLDIEGKQCEIGAVPGDGDCFFYSSGVTRNDFAEYLKNSLDDNAVHDYVKGELYGDARTYFFLKEGKNDAFGHDETGQKAVTHFFSQIDQQDVEKIWNGMDQRRPLEHPLMQRYIELVFKKSPNAHSPRYISAGPSIVNLMANFLGKNVQVFFLKDRDEVALYRVSGETDIPLLVRPNATFMDQYNHLLNVYKIRNNIDEITAKMLFGAMGLSAEQKLDLLQKSQTDFNDTVSIIQRGQHFDVLLKK